MIEGEDEGEIARADLPSNLPNDAYELGQLSDREIAALRKYRIEQEDDRHCDECGDQLATDADHGWICLTCSEPREGPTRD